jgi:importin-5
MQAQAFSMTQGRDAELRESAFRVFAGSSMLVMDLQTDAVLRVLKGGLEDMESIDVRTSPFMFVFVCTDVRSFYRLQVRLATLRASVPYLSSLDVHQLAQSFSLLYPMLNTLPSRPQSHFPKFISTITPLTTTNATLFQPSFSPTSDPSLSSPQRL